MTADSDDLNNFEGWRDHFAEAMPSWTEESLREMWDASAGHEDFVMKAAHRKYEECTTYLCVNGCCSVDWHPALGNIGGAGPAGCSCDDLDDPRGPNPRLLSDGKSVVVS